MADLIPADRLIDFTPGVKTGLLSAIPTLTDVELEVDNTGATDVSAAINAAWDALSANQQLRLDAGTFRCDYTLYRQPNRHSTWLRGQPGGTTIIDSRATTAISHGSSGGFVLPYGSAPSDYAVTSGLSKGSTTLSIGSTATLSVGQLVSLRVEDDPALPVVSTYGHGYNQGQIVRVVTIPNSTSFTFFPPLYDDYGAGARAAKIGSATSQNNFGGIRDLTIDFTTVMDTPGLGTTGIKVDGCRESFFKDITVKKAKNYPFWMENSLNVELQRLFLDDRYVIGGGSPPSGAGLLHNTCCASLVLNSYIKGNFPDIEVNFSSSGNVFAFLYLNGSYLSTNHAPHNHKNYYGYIASPGGIMSDGYFGGSSDEIVEESMFGWIAMKRFNRRLTLVRNLFNRTPDDFTAKAGDPNLANDSSTGTAPPWADLGMTGEIVAHVKGTGAGYLVNHSGGYTAGAASIALDTGTGTIIAGDVVVFSGSATRYRVASNLSGGVLTLTDALTGAVADNASVTVETDTCDVRFDSGSLSLITSSGAASVVPLLFWSGHTSSQIYQVASVTGNVARLTPSSIYAPNAVATPAVGTDVEIGPGVSQFQEKDGDVLATAQLRGNRWSNGFRDTMDGNAEPTTNRLYGTTKPQWLLDEEALYSRTFDLIPFDASTGTGSHSSIPAGYRGLFATPPEKTGISVDSAGTTLTVTCNKDIYEGVGGPGTLTLIVSGTGPATATFSHISAAAVHYDLSRTITDAEALTATFTNAVNGLQDVSGNLLSGFSLATVVNYSDVESGATYLLNTPQANATVEVPWDGSNAVESIMPIYFPTGCYVTEMAVLIKNSTSPVTQFMISAYRNLDIIGTGSGTFAPVDAVRFVTVLADSAFRVEAGETIRFVPKFNAHLDVEVMEEQGLANGSSHYWLAAPYLSSPSSSVVLQFSNTIRECIRLKIIPDPVAPPDPGSWTISGALTANVLTLGG